MNKHIGSDFDNFLKDEGILEEIEYQSQCTDHDIVECGRRKDQGLPCAVHIEIIKVPKPVEPETQDDYDYSCHYCLPDDDDE